MQTPGHPAQPSGSTSRSHLSQSKLSGLPQSQGNTDELWLSLAPKVSTGPRRKKREKEKGRGNPGPELTSPAPGLPRPPEKKKKKQNNNKTKLNKIKTPQTFYSLPQTAFNFLIAPAVSIWMGGAVHPIPSHPISLQPPLPTLPWKPSRDPPDSKPGTPECIPPSLKAIEQLSALTADNFKWL